MKSFLTCFTMTVFGNLLVAEDNKDIPKELLPFQGKWVVKEWTGGKNPPASKEKYPTFTVKGDQFNLIDAGKDKGESMKFTVSPNKKPSEINLLPESEKESSIEGIFKFEKGTLTLCLEMEGPPGKYAPRPKAFKADKTFSLIVLVKEDKKEK